MLRFLGSIDLVHTNCVTYFGSETFSLYPSNWHDRIELFGQISEPGYVCWLSSNTRHTRQTHIHSLNAGRRREGDSSMWRIKVGIEYGFWDPLCKPQWAPRMRLKVTRVDMIVSTLICVNISSVYSRFLAVSWRCWGHNNFPLGDEVVRKK